MNQNILNKLHKFTSAQEPIKVELAKVSELASLVNQSRNVESEMVDAFVKARSILNTDYNLEELDKALIVSAATIPITLVIFH